MLSKALATAKAVEPVYVENVFQTWLYTGNGSTQTITNGIDLAGKDGCVWLKSRSVGSNTYTVFNDSGTLKDLYTNGTASAGTASWTSWSSTGFSLSGVVNNSSETYASWTFRKAAKFFDVVTYTGNDTSQSIAHSLGSEPGFVIIKATSTSGNWVCYHRSLGIGSAVFLNLTNAATSASDISAVSSTTFSVSGSQPRSNASGQTYVAYLFAHDAGGFGDAGTDSVIKCDTFTTDGSGNATVNLGWEPQWVIMKNSQSAEGWWLTDNMRNSSLTSYSYLFANAADAEVSGSATYVMAPTATGFLAKNLNVSKTYIYIAIRRGPMKTPTDATKVFDTRTLTQAYNTTTPAVASILTDMFITGVRNALHNTWVADRMRGVPLLLTNTTAAEAGVYCKFDVQTGVAFSNSLMSSNSVFQYFFRRAPGFFDVVAYTGNGSDNRQIFHNLGAIPELMIVKQRSSTAFWAVYAAALGNTKYLNLSTTDAEATSSSVWSSATPTSTYFEVDGVGAVNQNAQTYIAYLFATCPGVSKVGSYTGTGTTQQINCGFTAGARFVLIKRTDSTGDWYVWDSARGIIAGNDPYLLLNSTAAEVTNTDYVDTFSSGFEISSTAPAAINANGGSFIFLAVA